MPEKSLIVIGGNRESEDSPLNHINDYCKKKKVKLLYVTNKIHLAKKCEKFESFNELLKKNKINFLEKNSLKNFNFLENYLNKNKNSIVLTTFCFLKINEKIIQLFKNRIFNYHLGKIPEQVGASATFWYTMSEQNFTAITFHKITNELDAGDIIYEKKFKMKNQNYSLKEFYKEVRKKEKVAINIFLDKIFQKNKLITVKKNYIDNKVYMPRLSTMHHGFINWNWTAREISSFCRVFDEPFKGATTFLQNEKVYLKKVSSHKHKIKFHPFQYGIIFNKVKSKIFVACKNGFIKAEITFDKKIKNHSKIVLGTRLYTDQYFLDQAKKKRSIHTKKGIKIKI